MWNPYYAHQHYLMNNNYSPSLPTTPNNSYLNYSSGINSNYSSISSSSSNSSNSSESLAATVAAAYSSGIGADESVLFNLYQQNSGGGVKSEPRSSSVSSDFGAELDSISATSTPNYSRFLSISNGSTSGSSQQFYPNGSNSNSSASIPPYYNNFSLTYNGHPSGPYDPNYLFPGQGVFDSNFGYNYSYPIETTQQFNPIKPDLLSSESDIKPMVVKPRISLSSPPVLKLDNVENNNINSDVQQTKVGKSHNQPSKQISQPQQPTDLSGKTDNRIVISCNDIDFKYPAKKVANPNVKAKLQDAELWARFKHLDTEMIITKAGRRMFPMLRISLSGLDAHSKYIVFVDIVPYDEHRYKYQNFSWSVTGKAEPHLGELAYLHPDSPMSGANWMKEIISFHKLKLTNNHSDESGFIILNSMHKYIPRFHVVEEGRSINTFVFEETVFMAVTSYQNELITKLKIENNPFAKGFRDVTNRRDHKTKRNEIQDDEAVPEDFFTSKFLCK